jgi:heme/copper-type cytochrome/quinol oxidase subunit 2
MIAEVTAVSPAKYLQWVTQQEAYLAAADKSARNIAAAQRKGRRSRCGVHDEMTS